MKLEHLDIEYGNRCSLPVNEVEIRKVLKAICHVERHLCQTLRPDVVCLNGHVTDHVTTSKKECLQVA